MLWQSPNRSHRRRSQKHILLSGCINEQLLQSSQRPLGWQDNEAVAEIQFPVFEPFATDPFNRAAQRWLSETEKDPRIIALLSTFAFHVAFSCCSRRFPDLSGYSNIVGIPKSEALLNHRLSLGHVRSQLGTNRVSQDTVHFTRLLIANQNTQMAIGTTQTNRIWRRLC